MRPKISTVVMTIGLGILLLITCGCETENQQAEAPSSTDASYQTKEQRNNLGQILSPNTQVEKIAGGFKFTEGPVWHPDGFLLFSDIPANTIYKWQLC